MRGMRATGDEVPVNTEGERMRGAEEKGDEEIGCFAGLPGFFFLRIREKRWYATENDVR